VESQKDPAVGLCLDCANVKLFQSDRGSVFYSCLLTTTDARFPKYPRLPVLLCNGYLQKVVPDAE